MKPLDRVLCVTAGLLGMGAFVAGVRTGRSAGITVGIVALLVGLTVASLVARR